MLELDRLEKNTFGDDPAGWQEEFNIANDNLRVDAAKVATSSAFGKVVLKCKDDLKDAQYNLPARRVLFLADAHP